MIDVTNGMPEKWYFILHEIFTLILKWWSKITTKKCVCRDMWQFLHYDAYMYAKTPPRTVKNHQNNAKVITEKDQKNQIDSAQLNRIN